MRLDTFMQMAGEKFVVEREDGPGTVEGIKNREEKKIDLKPGTDVLPGDWLKANSGHRFYIHETDVQMFQRKPFALNAYYWTEAEHGAAQSPPQPEAAVFNIFGDTYGSIIGSQGTAEMRATFDFRELDVEIERRGGEDTEALKEMVGEIRRTLENQDSISRGRFLQFSELIDRHGWITGPIAQLILLYTLTGQFS